MDMRIRFLLLAIVGLALAGCGHQAKHHPPPIVVSSTVVQRGDLPLKVQTLGQAQASHAVTIVPQVSGILQKVAIHSGEQVQKGQLLFVIDPSTAAAQVAQDEANLQGEKAQERYEREQVEAYQPLLKKDYVTRQTFEQAQSQAQSAAASIAADRAALRAAEINLRHTQITAPIGGVAGLLQIRSGNLVTANSTQLLTIERTQPMYVQFSLPEKYLGDLRRSLATGSGKVQIWDENHQKILATGVLRAIDDTVNTASATVTAQAMVPNQDQTLWPGEYVQVEYIARILHDVAVIPATALQQGISGPYVYHIVDGKAQMQPVEFLGQDENRVAVHAKHLIGEQIVVGAPARLHPGMTVTALSAQ
ncbi:efflux RND transporter periplasmic adaptor subunit [Acidithiobacillus sp. AMEEHan]|uniref:efflux RND transporter periplasmic adaptor subunit n=1 Tax=Acidithiobacillus sp. AMEEHan TaxID=2994951 RepID=UPI0027E452C7|nr:efflux RND transporter periplasmic adaptor subunit [Acidithiobacillus sp. AMEEHan]